MWLLLAFVIVLLSKQLHVNAEVIQVGNNSLDFTQGNKLIIHKNPDIKGFEITTNISKDRLKRYYKDADTERYTGYGGAWYFMPKHGHQDKFPLSAYQTQTYKSYEPGYASETLVIKNLQKTDQIKIQYENVGTYAGKPIDMQVVFDNMQIGGKKRSGGLTDDTTYIDFSANPFSGYVYTNILNADVTYTIYDRETGDVIDADGNTYLTFNSLNSYNNDAGEVEFVNYLNHDVTAKNSPVNAYTITDTNVKWRDNLPNHPYKKTVFYGSSNDFTDYLGGETFTRNTVQFQIKGKSQKFVFGSGLGAAWNSVSTGVLFSVTAEPPTKTVEDSKGTTINGRDVQVGQELVYNVRQKVNILGQDILEKYDKWTITDTLPANVDYVKAELTDESGKVIQNPGEIVYDKAKHKVTFTASDAFLKEEGGMKYTGETYNLRIHTKVKNFKADAKSKELEIENQAFSNIDGVEKESNTVKNRVKLFKVNVKHIFQKEDKLLSETTEAKYDGESYSYSPLTNLKYKEKFNYVPINNSKQEGVINGHDVNLTFYYGIPILYEVGVRKIQIYTAPFDEGLPLKLELSQKLHEAKSKEVLKGRKLNLVVKDKSTGKTVLSKQYDISDIDDEISLKIPSNFLKLNSNTSYEATISLPGNEDGDLLLTDSKIDTKGYTSSQKKVKAKSTEDLSYKGVVMTEREINKDMKIFYESFQIKNPALPKQKTGYGFDLDTSVIYKNDLKKAADIKLQAVLDSNLIDSYLNYDTNGEKTTIQLDNFLYNKSTDGVEFSYGFQLPLVKVEKGSGALFTETQVKNKDVRIKNDLIDGGNKLYVPIWADLGTYNINIQSTDSVGINEITLDLEKKLPVYAYMFATVGSDTLDLDELLLEPVNPTDPFPDGVPEGWSDKDVEWLMQ